MRTLVDTAAGAEPRLPGACMARGPLGAAATLAAALRNPHRLWRREHFEEPVVRVSSIFGDRLVIADPEAIRRVLVDAPERYARDPAQRHLLTRITGASLFSAEGEDWRLRRQTLAPFFTPRAVERFSETFREAALRWCDSAARAGRVDLVAGMAGLAVGVIGRTLLGDRLGEPPHEVARNIRAFSRGAGRVGLSDLLDLPDWAPRLGALRVRSEAARVRARAIRIRKGARAAPRAGDELLAALFAARDETGAPLDCRRIDGDISTLIGAGADTTGLAIAWAIYLACADQAVSARLDAEVGALDPQAPAARLAELPFVRAVIEEAMRLYPPAPAIGRAATVDDRVGDLLIRRGVAVVIGPWAVHRHRKLWARPDDFEPDRFMPDRRGDIARFSYLPFGAGRRVCIGQHYAMQEAAIALATIWRRLRFRRVGEPPQALMHNITLQPVGGLNAAVELRG